MRQSLRCPKCQHGEILVLRNVAGELVYLAKDRASADGRAWRRAAPREAYICRACGYTEYYTRDVAAIPVDGELVEVLGGPGPYR